MRLGLHLTVEAREQIRRGQYDPAAKVAATFRDRWAQEAEALEMSADVQHLSLIHI